MAQPTNYGFGEEAALLKESARKFFTDNFATETLHSMVAGDHDPERMSDCAWDEALAREPEDSPLARRIQAVRMLLIALHSNDAWSLGIDQD